MKPVFRQWSMFIAPFLFLIVFPACILAGEGRSGEKPLLAASIFLLSGGAVLVSAGFSLFILTIFTFLKQAEGTIMPWAPSRKQVVSGVYAHVRNPMISGILLTLAGEALLFASWGIAILAALFFAVNTVYFKASEEPGLVRRFGVQYEEYRKHVPMWLPRIKPYRKG